MLSKFMGKEKNHIELISATWKASDFSSATSQFKTLIEISLLLASTNEG